jgi:hypothetical protein
VNCLGLEKEGTEGAPVFILGHKHEAHAESRANGLSRIRFELKQSPRADEFEVGEEADAWARCGSGIGSGP